MNIKISKAVYVELQLSFHIWRKQQQQLWTKELFWQVGKHWDDACQGKQVWSKIQSQLSGLSGFLAGINLQENVAVDNLHVLLMLWAFSPTGTNIEHFNFDNVFAQGLNLAPYPTSLNHLLQNFDSNISYAT